ncbi:MAG: DUF58 domain-containing protein [Nitrospirota bacterium]
MKIRPVNISYGGRSLTFTALGSRFIMVTLAVGVAAVNSGSNLLYLIVAMMLSMMLISGILSDLVLWSIHVDRKVPPEIYAGSPFPLRFKVKNSNKLAPSYALAVSQKNQEGSKTAGAFVFRLGPGEEGDAQALETIAKRGRWTTSGYEIATRYPFGLFRKAVLLRREESCTVYPRIRALPTGLSEGLSRSLQDETQSSRKGQGGDLRSLREYSFPEDARGIHWKASARAGKLLSKEFEAQERQAVAVIIDNLVPVSPPDDYAEHFEEAVSLAASFVRHIIFDLERPVYLVSRSTACMPFQDGRDYISLMDELAGLMFLSAGSCGPKGASGKNQGGADISGVLSEWPSVLILPTPSCGWAAFSSIAGTTCEAGTLKDAYGI